MCIVHVDAPVYVYVYVSVGQVNAFGIWHLHECIVCVFHKPIELKQNEQLTTHQHRHGNRERWIELFSLKKHFAGENTKKIVGKRFLLFRRKILWLTFSNRYYTHIWLTDMPREEKRQRNEFPLGGGEFSADWRITTANYNVKKIGTHWLPKFWY